MHSYVQNVIKIHLPKNKPPPPAKISLNCQTFALEDDNKLLCEYWQSSQKLNTQLNLNDFKLYHAINEISDLSPPDYAYYATSTLVQNGIRYHVFIYPNSRVTLENPHKKVKNEYTGLWGNEKIEYICQNNKCKNLFLWGYADERIAGEHPEIEEQIRQEYDNLLERVSHSQ